MWNILIHTDCLKTIKLFRDPAIEANILFLSLLMRLIDTVAEIHGIKRRITGGVKRLKPRQDSPDL